MCTFLTPESDLLTSEGHEVNTKLGLAPAVSGTGVYLLAVFCWLQIILSQLSVKNVFGLYVKMDGVIGIGDSGFGSTARRYAVSQS